jgi:branched-chain amino acid transport system ATP-binding protein
MSVAQPATAPSALLEVTALTKNFRGLRAVSDVSFVVPERGIVALIGPNGAGKTTTFNMIAGVFPPSAGRVVFGGTDITGKRPDQICAAGVGRTFQIVKPFPDMTVLENVTVGALQRAASVTAAKDEARRVLTLLDMHDRAEQPAASLTLPDRKRLEVARALATRPRLLLLDEVMAGLRPTETDRMVVTLKRLRDETGLTILLIEHVMRAVMALSERVVVLHHGERIAEGTPAEITRDPKVLESYLGEGAVH